MGHVLPTILLIAVADSANPSTIGPALYFAAGKSANRNLLAFIAAIFVVYLVGGLVIVLGPGQALLALIPRPSPHTRHLLELCLGVALLVLACVLWLARKRIAARGGPKPGRAGHSSFRVGAGIAAVELPTAFPYFAAIAAILASGKNVATQVGLLASYDVVFIAPLLAILGVRFLAGDRGQGFLQELRADLDARLAVLLPALVLIAAVVLIALGTVGLR
jgi:cytochrome c biogenesis protein CcdA